MSTKRAEFDTLADESDDGSYDGSEYSEESAGSEERKLQQKLEEVKRKKDETENEATTLSRNSQIEARHHKTMVAFAPAWLISPFIPFLESLITIFVGSVLIGTTNVSECTEPLDIYAGGTVFVSYLYIIVYGGAFIGLCHWKFTNMMSYKLVFGLVVALYCIWHIVGQIIFGSASACADSTPPLYSYVKFQLTMFWATVIGFVLCAARFFYMAKYADQRAARAARADRIRKLEEEDRKLKEKAREEEEAVRAKEAAEEAEEEKRRKAQEEEDAKKRALAAQYGDSSDSDEDDGTASAGTGAAGTATPLPGSTGPGFQMDGSDSDSDDESKA